jgi:adenylate cyclase
LSRPSAPHAGGSRLPAGWPIVIPLPLILLALLLLRPEIDARWESHPAHFWLVLGASLVAVALGYSVSSVSRSRRDARLFLVSLAFIASAGFLGLHALATPGVLVGPTAGFELATPVGLLLGGAFVAASALDLKPATAARLIELSVPLLGVLLAAILVWGVASVAEAPPLNDPLQDEELNGWQTALGGIGIILYAAGAFGYLRLFRRRRARFAFAFTFAFALLAEAMVVIAFAANWQISWWEWHVLMLTAFLVIALAARREWPEERFSALYLDETLAGVKEASILFADLENYTAYAERTGPVEVAAMLNTYFARLVPLMQEMGGEVHQLVGDAIMVVFNKAGDQPDHALLAARAALALQSHATSISSAHPDWPRFRVGVNSGQVLAGVIGGERGHRKHGLVGDTVNLAARLQSEARAGEVVAGAGTVERLPPGSLLERLPPLRVKGKTEPVVAHILREIPHDARHVERGPGKARGDRLES